MIGTASIERRDIKRSRSITTDFREIGRAQSIHFHYVTLLNISRSLHRKGSTLLWTPRSNHSSAWAKRPQFEPLPIDRLTGERAHLNFKNRLFAELFPGVN